MIFISFRNGDGDWAAKLIKDRLVERFGDGSAFLSSDSIGLAAPFPDELVQAASTCDVLLALVGPTWRSFTNAAGRPRLFTDDDWVRREIATAVAARRPVAAVRLDGAPRLKPDDLPADIREIASRQDTTLTRRTFDADIVRLEEQLIAIVPGLAARRRPRTGVTVTSVVEIDEGDHVDATGAALPATDRPVAVDHRVKMKKGKRVRSTALRMGERESKKADPALPAGPPGGATACPPRSACCSAA